jgi:hypothetical protein
MDPTRSEVPKGGRRQALERYGVILQRNLEDGTR